MRSRALLVAVVASLVAGASSEAQTRVETCTSSPVDVADWPIVRSARVPGFTLRLPRSFTRDADPPGATGASRSAATTAAAWTDATHSRFVMSRLAAGSARAPLPQEEGRADYRRCEAAVGSAVAIVVSYSALTPAGATELGRPYVVVARITWRDGEELEVAAYAAGRHQLDPLLAAMRTIRRTGA